MPQTGIVQTRVAPDGTILKDAVQDANGYGLLQVHMTGHNAAYSDSARSIVAGQFMADRIEINIVGGGHLILNFGDRGFDDLSALIRRDFASGNVLDPQEAEEIALAANLPIQLRPGYKER